MLCALRKGRVGARDGAVRGAGGRSERGRARSVGVCGLCPAATLCNAPPHALPTAKIERGAGLRAQARGGTASRRPPAEPEQPEPLDAAETATAPLISGCTRSDGVYRNLLPVNCPVAAEDIALETFQINRKFLYIPRLCEATAPPLFNRS